MKLWSSTFAERGVGPSAGHRISAERLCQRQDFFSRKCERVLSVKALYDFVMRDGSDDDVGIRAALDIARSQDSVTEQEDPVFMDAFLPRSLQDPGELARRLSERWSQVRMRMASTKLWATCWVPTFVQMTTRRRRRVLA